MNDASTPSHHSCNTHLDWIETMGLTPQANGICRSGCPTQDHTSYADCLQDARIAIDKTSLK